MKCEYDDNPFACFSCPFADCVRENIKRDIVKELAEKPVKKREKYRATYERTDAAYQERLRLKRLGLPLPEKHYKCKGREADYQREYRSQMPEEQRERYRVWQREYARKKRAKVV